MSWTSVASITRRLAPKRAKDLYRRFKIQIDYPLHRGYLNADFDRIYHIHIRKCAGTSLNAAFINYFADSKDENNIEMLAQKVDHRIEHKRGPVVGWNSFILARGAFAYGFSHVPYPALQLPPRTFTFTFLRDPSERVISHFKMLKDMIAIESKHPAMATEALWAKGTFSEFLDHIPRKHLENQLYMFDQEFKVGQALSRLEDVHHVSLIEHTFDFIALLRRNFEINLQYEHRRKSSYEPTITEMDRHRLQEILVAEYAFFEGAKALIERRRNDQSV